MSTSSYSDLSRPPLRADALRRSLVVPGGLWTDLRVVAETGSTNADVAAAARAGAREGFILVAESQTAGRGRLDRQWQAPPRAAITVSVLLRPGARVPPAHLGWLPLLTGVALVESVGRIAMVDAALKWPNDLLVRSSVRGDEDADAIAGYGKCAGILAEVVTGPDQAGPVGLAAQPAAQLAAQPGADGIAVVVGVGLNVSQRIDELPLAPDPRAFGPTSLAVVGAASTDRGPLIKGLLRALADWYERWLAVAGDPDQCGLREAYRARCRTIGREVSVALPNGAVVVGTATDVDFDGRLVLAAAEGVRSLAAGDVHHVR